MFNSTTRQFGAQSAVGGNSTTRQFGAQSAVGGSLEIAKTEEVGAEALPKATYAAHNEILSAPTLEIPCRTMSDTTGTAVGPAVSAASAMASRGISTTAALASETAAALLSAAAETAAAAMETGGHLDETHMGLPAAAGTQLRNIDVYKSDSEPKDAESTTVEEEDDLPAFADEESIALHGEIRDKERLLSRQGTELGQKAERVVLMRQHLQQLKAEADHLENLVAAKEAHINSDKHMEGVAVRQASKLRSEMQQHQQQQQHLQSRLTALQLDVAKGQEQMDCFKLQMKWNEEELAQWRSAAHQKEEDLACIAEFKKKDDVRAAGLMAQAQKASAEVTEAKKRLQEEQTAARAARAELQRSLEYFAEQQKDRALLIAQGQQSQNKELQGGIASLEQQLTQCRSTYSTATMAVSQLTEEVAGLRGQLSATATRGKTAKGQLVELHESLAVQKQRLDSTNKKKEAAQRKLAKEQENVRSAGEAGDAREAFHTQVATRLQQLQQRVKSSRDALFVVAQKLAEEKATLKMKRGGLSSSKNALRSLQAQLQQQEAEKSRQQELLYSIDFQCQAMQRRVSRISGYKTAAETKALQKQMKELQAESTLQQEEQSTLSSQVKHLDGELRKAQRTLARVDEEDSRCANNVGDIRLACASLDRELQTIVKQKEKLVLAESLRKLEVTRLHEELEACADASLEAENRKVQHQLQVQEVLAAMELELDGARGQLRAVEEEKRKLNKEAAERRSKISALEARYENVMQSSQTADGAGRSQAYYVIRVGQEREELQRKGAEMHRRLQSASVEVQGLEASLRDVSLSNSRLRSRLQRETGAVGALREQKAEKEGALFLRNHMAFTQQQQICLLKEAIEKEERCLEQTKQEHQRVLERLRVCQTTSQLRGHLPFAKAQKEPRVSLKRHVDEKRKDVENESNSVDEKLQRSIKQRLKLQTSIQKRRLGGAPSSQPAEANEESQLCNAEIQYHAECLEGMLQSLYRSMGPTVASQPAALETLQRALGEGKDSRYCNTV
ncbi:uncharacterized protein EMH_0024130 [Eimeria mitis]|uniref:Uncharacterized protein n=1 Tax=Eimeria mitis TaxID=44415 RepID=U6JUI4_9EIME|nr:uncharacterized protein EMH_0024130 [Eimeria mitis]CDJ29130.1 hypothetical protein, conserved [Eimeria mitis]